MIQKISFTSQYGFVENKLQKYSNQEVNITHALQHNLFNLQEGDEITISRNNEGFMNLRVPNYMDSDIETFCLYSGIAYKKEN